ncbi:MAG: RNA polymerase sigma factor, partial [Planctomycetota bacterium]
MDDLSDPELRLQERLQRHQARVRRLVCSLLRDEHAAEDIVQDAWVIAMRRPPSTSRAASREEAHPDALGSWFGRVAKNLALNARRGDRRRTDREERAGEERRFEGSGSAISSGEIVARLEVQRRLMDSLEALDEPHRSLLRDHFLGEQSLAAIARRDRVAESTLRSRLKSGLAALRAQLDAFIQEGLG